MTVYIFSFFVVLFAVFIGMFHSQFMRIFSHGNYEELKFEDHTNSKIPLFTKKELSKFNGENGVPIYLALLGSVYDVSKGRKHYGPGCTYNYFVARDASVSFITGEYNYLDESESDDVHSLNSNELISLTNWEKFYKTDYTFKGRLIGRFFDSHGGETEYYRKFQELLTNAKKIKNDKERLHKIYPDCNIEWSAEKGTHVWCADLKDDQSTNKGYPRKLFEGNSEHFRCVCIKDYKLEPKSVTLKSYDGCHRMAHECFYTIN